MRPLVWLASFGSLALFVTGCSSASPDEQGGTPRFDAGPPSVTVDEEGGNCSDTAFDAAAGTAWSDLYRDYFGATAVSGCSGASGQCHGDASSLGGGIWVCGANASSCYAGITSLSADLVTPGDTKDSPTTSTLYLTLRKTCGGGEMPKQPTTFFFSPSDMQRISDWIGAGAPGP